MKDFYDIDVKEEFALVTGATSGFGYEFARLFAEAGYNLVLVSRDEERLLEIKEELTGRYPQLEILIVVKDLFRREAAEELYEMIQLRELHVEYLVNDAGQGEWGHFADVDLQRNLDIIQLNVVSLVSLTKFFMSAMITRGRGGILQVGAEAGKMSMPLLSVYAATKAFVTSFSEALANELKGTGVAITLLMPGASDTDFFHKAHANHTVAYREEKLASARAVAKDGFEALMRNEMKVVSGVQKKLGVIRTRLALERNSAEANRKLMELSHKPPFQGRMDSMHAASRASRARISMITGRSNGDYPPDRIEEMKVLQPIMVHRSPNYHQL